MLRSDAAADRREEEDAQDGNAQDGHARIPDIKGSKLGIPL
jgi:hypothetical protein